MFRFVYWCSLLGSFVLSSCGTGDSGQNSINESSRELNLTPEIPYCGESQISDLLAGQFTDAGDVIIRNTEDTLTVLITTTGDWLMMESHVHVADTLEGIPQNRKGQPKIGNFDYQRSHSDGVTVEEYIFNKDELTFASEDQLTIAVHAVVVRLNEFGDVIQEETGWGDGSRFVSKGSWAMYTSYTWQDCETNPEEPRESATETAFAYGGELATCFLDIESDLDTGTTFNRWGWTNGLLEPGSYVFDIYAGAGRCDLTKGVFVGVLQVEYDGQGASVSFDLTESNEETGLPYGLIETHLYIGNDILAMNNDSFTVAPGQYPYIHENLLGNQSDSYYVTGLSGPIHIVAHATVDGFAP